ncbi:uncharacterized protein EDB91DRAFT_754023 [Suillus paluster]|uniref:uncharacterized protein n=1 Tax=Suillus paluster TaxID=48578 RepID=UPI001B86F5FE|nr:uncharacterized protein EDB91DRAFT_754023 [Suillus paluster]KAG1749615.1 hypothetical protein EDB91DRAFT_754023 [Suillus paluster]
MFSRQGLGSHPKNPSENASDGLFSARSYYTLRITLVIVHIVFVIFYVRHREHRVTFSTNNDFWSVVLSALLQAFYTMIYTTVLLFLTQRLANSRALVRRLKLTAIYDISGAWAGLVSALSSVWRQTDIPPSWWMTSAVTVYLASMSVLHVTSSTLLQFQTFNTSIPTSVPTILGWPNDLTDSISVNWGSITALSINSLDWKCNCECNDHNLAVRIDPQLQQALHSVLYGGNYSLRVDAGTPWSDQTQVLQEIPQILIMWCLISYSWSLYY